MFSTALLALFATAVSGQSCKSSTGTGRVAGSVSVGSSTRAFSMYVPTGVTYPSALVLAWHGISSSPSEIESKMKMQAQADTHKFILVFPEARNAGSGTLLNPVAFNGAACCKNDATFDEVGLARAIKAQLTGNGCVDGNRVYSMGYSNGGFTTHRIACEDSTIFRAAAVHSGTYGDYSGVLANSPWANCDTKAATPVIGFHGTSDGTVPFNGGKNPSPLGNSVWGSFDQQMNIWAKSAGNTCGAATSVSVSEGGLTNNRTTWAGCGVTANQLNGLDHSWWTLATDKIITHFKSNGL